MEDTGFSRNWWVGLSMLHTLFVREHNAICDMLHEAYPDWDDNRLFNVARLDQRRGDGEDPFHRVDPGHSAQPGARHRR